MEFYYANNKDKKCLYILLENIERNITNGINMYLFGDAIRFDAYKHKKAALNDFAEVIFSEIKNSLNTNCLAVNEIDSFIEINRNEDYLDREGLMEKIKIILNEKKKLCLFGYLVLAKHRVL